MIYLLHYLMVKHRNCCGIIKAYFLSLPDIEYQNSNFRVVMLSCNYLPMVLGLNIIKYVFEKFTRMSVHIQENYCKHHYS